MNRKVKIILIVVLVLIVGYVVCQMIFRTCCAPKPQPTPSPTPTAKELRLADPNLLYASSWWAGLCSNEKQEQGGCYRELYLYSDGRYIKISGFVRYNEEGGREEHPDVQEQLTLAAVEKIRNMIRDSGIMTKVCPAGRIMDAGWDYQINIDSVKKSFHNPQEDCLNTFNMIDDTLDMPIE